MEDRDLSPRESVEGRQEGDTAEPRSVSLYVNMTTHSEKERERDEANGR